MSSIFIGSDHAGFELKQEIKAYLEASDYQVEDMGCHGTDSVDYPDYAKAVAEAVLAGGEESQGILICGTGIGVCIAANKFHGIRAALCPKEYEAQMARNHNNANVLCLGARALQKEVAKRVVSKFLESKFEGGRHQRRLDKIAAISAPN